MREVYRGIAIAIFVCAGADLLEGLPWAALEHVIVGTLWVGLGALWERVEAKAKP